MGIYIGKQRYVYAIGDPHGDYISFNKLINIYDRNRHAEDILITLGDYADRGPDSVRLVEIIYKLLKTRKDIIALLGNHERMAQNGYFNPYGNTIAADAERSKYRSWNAFTKAVFNGFLGKLYTAALVNNALFVHGGISSRIKDRESLSNPFLEDDLLWSDPTCGLEECFNWRGLGFEFPESVTEAVCKRLGVNIIVRSHEPRKASAGPFSEHSGRVLTLNGCSLYGQPAMVKIDTIELDHETYYA
jgi:hypothetical protein